MCSVNVSDFFYMFSQITLQQRFETSSVIIVILQIRRLRLRAVNSLFLQLLNGKIRMPARLLDPESVPLPLYYIARMLSEISFSFSALCFLGQKCVRGLNNRDVSFQPSIRSVRHALLMVQEVIQMEQNTEDTESYCEKVISFSIIFKCQGKIILVGC